MHTETKAILESNQGRDPERLKMKLAAIRENPFAFFRGTCPLFYDTLRLDRSLLSSPLVLACGDLHLENFASYKGDNRLVYFDINDFDESCVAPLAFDLVRFVTSILVAAKPLKISDKMAMEMIAAFLETYAATIKSTKPRWVERSIATGPVKSLLQSVKGRHRGDLIEERTVRKSGKRRLKIDGEKTLAVSSKDRAQAESILAAYASIQRAPAFFEPIDIAKRIAGNGSLGLERYVALVRGTGKADGQYLVDIKFSVASSLVKHTRARQPAWKSEAERASSIQLIAQAIPPALLGSIGVGGRAYLIKELEPTADRLDLAKLRGKSGMLVDVVRTMAQVAAWAHLRSCGRLGSASVEDIATFAARDGWRKQITKRASVSAALALQQWQNYSADYDADPDHLLPAARPT